MSGERLFKPFVFLISFISVAVLLISMTQDLAYSNTVSTEVPSGYEIVGGWNYTMMKPLDGAPVNQSIVSDHMVYPTDAPINFYRQGGTEGEWGSIWVQIIRDNVNFDAKSSNIWKRYKDFISFQRAIGGPVSHDWRNAAISYPTIATNVNRENDTSTIAFTLGASNGTLFVYAENLTIANKLWDNNYTLFLGQHRDYNTKASLTTALTMLLSMSIPGCDPIINAVLFVFFWSAIIFIAMTLISRFLPFIGGG